MSDTEQDKRKGDIFIGKRIRLRRESLGYTLRDVASKAGLTYQQLQKYETGKDGLRLETLLKISEVLNVKLSYFDLSNGKDTELDACKPDADYYKRSVNMMKTYNNIKCHNTKKHLYKLIVNIDKNYNKIP